VAVLWPSFLVAGVATILIFVMFDPQPMLAGTPWAGLSRLGAYSVGFFWFWLITAASSWLTCYFQRPPRSLN
jgi:multisubunit Na+/H+ antiporter MnhB subunit